MSEEQKALLAAAKSFDADVERAKCISIIAESVLHEMCKVCGQTAECEKLSYGLLKNVCRMTAIASVAVGMIGEKPEGGEKPRKIADRFRTADEATEAHAKERVLMVFDWAQIKWLYMEDVEGESRLDYLKRCRTEGILKSDGYKELKRLEKAAKEGGAK